MIKFIGGGGGNEGYISIKLYQLNGTLNWSLKWEPFFFFQTEENNILKYILEQYQNH